MGLRDEVQVDIAAAFDTDLADAVTDFDLLREVPGGYDPATGTTGTTTESYAGRGVFGMFSRDEVDDVHIFATDIKLLLLQSELPATPKVGDKIDSPDQRVEGVMQDPAAATWTLVLRRT
tara:strand:- start:1198 stop:1557 length:360 start_codon:yes stop_codon:yes gene_type:complete